MIEIDKKVFRGNDIRGKVNIDITDEFRKDPISDLNRYVIKVEDYDEVSFKR